MVFTVDGRTRAVDRRPPFLFTWGTTRAKPGRHVLRVVATSVDGRTAIRRIPVVVYRPKPKPAAKPTPKPVPLAIVGQSVTEGQQVSGLVVWRVDVRGRAEQVEFLVDGVLRGTDVQRPFTLGWDTSTETPGAHRLEARVVGAGGRSVAAELTVTVPG